MIINDEFSIDFNNVYYVKSADEFISDAISFDNHISKDEIIIINALSKKVKPILLPIYKTDSRKKLKKAGINYKVGVSDLDFLRFILNNEVQEHVVVFFGLTGLHHEGVSFLKKYTLKLAKENNNVFFLIDYDSNYNDTTITQLFEE